MTKRIHRRRDADPEDGLEKYGDATFADPVNKKYPIDTPGRIGSNSVGGKGAEDDAAPIRMSSWR
jgi:hypothetical protein